MKKNSFIKVYTDLPDTSGLRFGVFATLLLINIFNLMMADLFEIVILKHTFWDIKMTVYALVILAFDLWSVVMFVFAKKLAYLFYLYTAIAFTGSSLYYLYVFNTIMLFDFGLRALPFLLISIAVYVLVITTIICNIKSKMERKYYTYANNKNTALVALIGGVIGVFLLPKPHNLDESHLPLAITLLVLSYLLAFTSSGFHKFYLIVKDRKSNKHKK